MTYNKKGIKSVYFLLGETVHILRNNHSDWKAFVTEWERGSHTESVLVRRAKVTSLGLKLFSPGHQTCGLERLDYYYFLECMNVKTGPIWISSVTRIQFTWHSVINHAEVTMSGCVRCPMFWHDNCQEHRVLSVLLATVRFFGLHVTTWAMSVSNSRLANLKKKRLIREFSWNYSS